MRNVLWGIILSLAAQAQNPQRSVHEQFAAERSAYRPQVKSALARQFLDASKDLPRIKTRIIYRERLNGPFGTDPYFTSAERDALPAEHQSKLEAVQGTEEEYYLTHYGTPLSYARPLDLLAAHGFSNVAGKRILDFGFGYIGHLRMLAMLGADARGVDLDQKLAKLYAQKGDQGAVKGAGGKTGKLSIFTGSYPTDAQLAQAVGKDFDLIISKNVLKRGYLHPEREADPKKLLNLGVSDEVFVETVFAALKPGGKLLIYNICPAPASAEKPYIPWADGRSPFSVHRWENAGFRVLAFDVNDDVPVRAMAKAYGWNKSVDDEPGMDLEHDLFAWYTLLEKPVAIDAGASKR